MLRTRGLGFALHLLFLLRVFLLQLLGLLLVLLFELLLARFTRFLGRLFLVLLILLPLQMLPFGILLCNHLVVPLLEFLGSRRIPGVRSGVGCLAGRSLG